MKRLLALIPLLLMPLFAYASEEVQHLDLTGNWVGIASVLLFFVAYLVVMVEEFTHLRKSKPVMLAAGIIWALIAWYYQSHDIPHQVMYGDWGATNTNIAIGIISAVVDHIPVMFAVLTMMPDMSIGQWLLVTMTAGVGGSLLSIGSAAGVALMGQARGVYTFFDHLKWTPAIALGYAASIGTHMLLNKHLF